MDFQEPKPIVPYVTDVLSITQRARCMSSVRGKNTAPELVLRRLLSALGYRFRLHVASLPGKPDIVLAGRKKAVFCHGCFWHMHDCKRGRSAPATNREFWKNKRLQNVRRDARTQAALRKLGWLSEIVWECELVKPTQDLASRLQAFLGLPCGHPRFPGK